MEHISVSINQVVEELSKKIKKKLDIKKNYNNILSEEK